MLSFIEADDTSIEVGINFSMDDNGIPIDKYDL
jgi:hypothetical protein